MENTALGQHASGGVVVVVSDGVGGSSGGRGGEEEKERPTGRRSPVIAPSIFPKYSCG